MNIIAIIPARMGSSRFPGKPMAPILGMPMIGHVYRRTSLCPLLKGVYVATCDHEIKDYIESIGGLAIMTSNSHERCTSRTAEALLAIEAQIGQKIDLVVMVQGDEPMLEPKSIEAAIEPFNKSNDIKVVNLMTKIKSQEEHNDPNEVKVVVDLNSDALYFSREAIPSRKKHKGEIKAFKQVCIIPFTRDFLLQFEEMKETYLERIESVDMMRILENGFKVKMVYQELNTYSVDTPEDLSKVENIMKHDTLKNSYLRPTQS